jgi:hypothetical protein
VPDYLVCQESNSEDDFAVGAARWVLAADEQDAAEQYMEVYHSDLDYAMSCRLRVRDKAGIVTRWAVENETVLHARAKKVEG